MNQYTSEINISYSIRLKVERLSYKTSRNRFTGGQKKEKTKEELFEKTGIQFIIQKTSKRDSKRVYRRKERPIRLDEITVVNSRYTIIMVWK